MLRTRESSKPAVDPRDLPDSRQLLLLLHLRLDLNPARLDALLQWQRQAQHSMAMRGGEFLEIEELRNHQRLFVARNVLVSAFARNLGANGEIVAGDLEGHVLRVDAGQWNVNAPAIIRRVYLERWGRTSRGGAGRQIAPELVEEAIHFTLKIEHVIERIPTSETKHRETSLLKTSWKINTTCLLTCQVCLVQLTHIPCVEVQLTDKPCIFNKLTR